MSRTNHRGVEIGLVTIAIVVSLLAADCSRAQTSITRELKFPTFDSSTIAHTLGANDPQFFWINNDELLFLAIRSSSDSIAPNKERVLYAVSRWDTRTAKVSIVQDFSENLPRICFYDGYVLYQFRRKDNSIEAYHGKLGEPARSVDGKDYGQKFCRRIDETLKTPQWMEGREVRPLEQLNAGFVDFGDKQKWLENSPVRLYRFEEVQAGGILLPFGRREIEPRFPYFRFKDAFFVESTYPRVPRPKEIPYPVFWLYRDGRTEKIAEIPWGPWRERASLWIAPTSAGIVIGTHNFRTETDLGHAGLYLQTPEGVGKVLTGWINGTVVSPDGCRIAYTYARVVTRKNNVLRAMNLCEGSRK